MQGTTGKSIGHLRAVPPYLMSSQTSALSVVVFLMLVGSVAAYTKATKEVLTHSTTASFLYLGTITATAPSLLPLVFLPALSGFFIEHAQTLGNHPRRALLINQPAGSGPLFPFTHSAIRHQRR